MQLIETTEKPAHAQNVGQEIRITTRVDQELLVGLNKPGIHPIIQRELKLRYAYSLGEIDLVHFNVERNEDSGIKGVRAILIRAKVFLRCS